jgi:hypothetical protein
LSGELILASLLLTIARMFLRALPLLLLFGSIALAQQADRPRLHPLNPQNANLKTGPGVGAKVPAFEAPDQNGQLQKLETLRGPKGLMLVFTRSADW